MTNHMTFIPNVLNLVWVNTHPLNWDKSINSLIKNCSFECHKTPLMINQLWLKKNGIVSDWTKTLPKPMLTYFQLDPHKYTPMDVQSKPTIFLFQKIHLKCHLHNICLCLSLNVLRTLYICLRVTIYICCLHLADRLFLAKGLFRVCVA